MKQLITISLIFIGHWLTGQEVSHFSKVEYYTSDNGLSQHEVTCILQDKKGFLWIGTRGGLNRYDGHNFKAFQNEIGNVNSLSNNSIEALYEDKSGDIWIGTKSNGLSRYNPEYGKFTHYQENSENNKGVSGNRVITIAESSKNTLWVGTWSNGITILNNKENNFSYLLEGQRINKILRSLDDKMWVSSANYLYEFTLEGALLNRFQAPSVGLLDIIEDKKNQKLYIGTWNDGLLEFDMASVSFRNVSLGQEDGTVVTNAYHLHLDNQGMIWIGSWNGGLSRYNPRTKTISKFDLSSGVNSRSSELYIDVLSIFKDRSGVLWVGTNGGGLCKIDNRTDQFGLMSENSGGIGLPKDPIWSLYKDNEGVLWVGEKGSENIYYSNDGINFSTLVIPKVNSGIQPGMKLGIRNIFQSKNGKLWVATNRNLYNISKTAKKYTISPVLIATTESDLPQRMIQVSILYQTSDGISWIGQQQRGLKKAISPGDFENQTFQSYTMSEKEGGIKSNRISALLEDRLGRFWVGTYNGLHLYRPATDDFLHYSKEQENINSLSSDIIISLYEDKKGNIWVGTPNGLNLAIPGINQSISFRCYQEKEGLPNNYIHAILEDDNGNLWISTNKGISKFNVEDGSFNNYNVNDGLQSNSFMENVALKDESGLFFFGGINGLNVFHPDSIKESLAIPQVVFTGIKIFNTEVQPGQKIEDKVILNKAIEYTEELTLSHSANVFTIEFADLNFSSSGNNQYSYRMQGLDDQWHNIGTQNNITYSNLSSGKYNLQVKAGSDRGIWNEKAANLQINILPPFWATWQAFFLYALGFVGLLMLYKMFINQQNELLNKLNLARLERKKDIELAEVKTEFFTNITHELRTPLTLISGPVEALLDDKKTFNDHRGHLHTIQHHSKRLLNLVNQLLDFRKAESGNMKIQVAKGNIVKYTKEIFLSFENLADQKNILFQFNVSDKTIPVYYDRRNMEIVICNLLSNAFKYTAENGKITLTINKVEDTSNSSKFPGGYCEIIVEDNGEGMSEEAVQKIFDRFYQIGKTNSVNLIGTGIGLALVKNIVDLHHGQVKVESKEGIGSKFVVQFPLGADHIPPENLINDFKNSEHISHYQLNEELKNGIVPLKKSLSTDEKKKLAQTLLIVEDNIDIRNFITEIFNNEYLILEAENGKEGLLKAEKYLPDIIISDVMMPEMDGHSLCKFIKSNERTSHIPFVMLTARTTNVYKVQGFEAGADAYVTKPFHPSVLKANIENLLLSRSKLRAKFSKLIRLEPTEIEIPSQDEQFLEKAIKLVEENLNNDNLNRDFLAKSLALSSSSLYRKLKSLTGFTTNAFVRSIRLKRAAQMMRDSNYNISEIAYQVGFNDLKYFRSCFKTQFGINPSQFIQNEPNTKKDFDVHFLG